MSIYDMYHPFMSLRYALLGLLAYEPASGYELTRQFDHSLGHYAWQARHTQIYPELNKLADEGAIEVVETGARGRRTYAITETGRAELLTWLSDPTEHSVVRNEGVLRMFLLSALEPEEAIKLLTREVQESALQAEKLRTLAQRADATAAQGERMPFGRLAAEFGLRLWEARREWALWALERIRGYGEHDSLR